MRLLARLPVSLALAALVLAQACGGGTGSPAGPSPAPVPVTHTTNGRVVDILAGEGVASVAVSLASGASATATSDASGYFSLVASSAGSWPTTFTAGSVVERNIGLRVPGPHATVGLIPASFDLTSFSQMFRVGGALQRWVVAPPLVVIRRTLVYTSYGNNTFVGSDEELSQPDAEGLAADLSDGFQSLTGGGLGPFRQVTYEPLAVGESVNVARPGVITVARYKGLTAGSGYWGYGRWATNGSKEVVGGIVMIDHAFDTGGSTYRRSLRIHELGHALGYDHVTSRRCVMNSSATVEPTDWDRQAVAIAFQRPPGNRAPDADPAGVSANRSPALRLDRVTWGPIIP